jgi:hypothetical protein
MPDDIDDDIESQSIELRRFDLHSMWRVLLWGASAAMALAIVAGTAFSDLGTDRIKQMVASFIGPANDTPKLELAKVEPPPPPQVTPRQLAALETQTRELMQSVRELTAERDSVKARLASLEQHLDDITGTVRRQAAETATQKSVQTATAPPVPTVTKPDTVAAVPSPTATTPPADTPTTTASVPPPAEASTPIEPPIPLPPIRAAEEAPIGARELGVDLGGAASLDSLRSHWSALKANFGPELVGLIPSYTTRQKQSGGTDYRLVLGPMPNSVTAARLCARLATSRIYCRPGTFTVQKFAERQRAAERPVEQLPGPVRDGMISR